MGLHSTTWFTFPDRLFADNGLTVTPKGPSLNPGYLTQLVKLE